MGEVEKQSSGKVLLVLGYYWDKLFPFDMSHKCIYDPILFLFKLGFFLLFSVFLLTWTKMVLCVFLYVFGSLCFHYELRKIAVSK
jgi:hypothetical protein